MVGDSADSNQATDSGRSSMIRMRPSILALDQAVGRIDQPHVLAGRLAHAKLVHHHLQAHQAAHAREQRGIVDRLGEEIVGAGIEPRDAVGRLVERGDHHDRHMGGLGIGLDAAADFEAVHARHHDVEQDDVGLVLLHALERFLAADRR